MPTTETDLLKAVRKFASAELTVQEQEVFGTIIYDELSRPLYRRILILSGYDEDTTCEVVQESLLRVLQHAGSCHAISNAQAYRWACRIAVNVLREFRRKGKLPPRCRVILENRARRDDSRQPADYISYDEQLSLCIQQLDEFLICLSGKDLEIFWAMWLSRDSEGLLAALALRHGTTTQSLKARGYRLRVEFIRVARLTMT